MAERGKGLGHADGGPAPDRRLIGPVIVALVGMALLLALILMVVPPVLEQPDKVQETPSVLVEQPLNRVEQPTRNGLLAMLPLPVVSTYGSRYGSGLDFKLQGDPAGLQLPKIGATMPVYRLAPPTALDKAAAQKLAHDLFGLNSEPLESPPASPDHVGIEWSWIEQGQQVSVEAWNSAFRWSLGSAVMGNDTPDIDLNDAVSQVRRWFQEHHINATMLDQPTLYANALWRQPAHEIFFRGNIDGYTIYPPSEQSWGYPSNTPGIGALYLTDKRQLEGITYTPARATIGSQNYPLATPQQAWSQVQSSPARHLIYSGIARGDQQTTVISPLDYEKDLKLDIENYVWNGLIAHTADLRSVKLGYAYDGDPGQNGELFLMPVYVFETSGPTPGGRELTSVFIAPAVASEYLEQWIAPRPALIRVFHRGDQITFAPGTPGYDEIYAASRALVEGIGARVETSQGYGQWKQRERDLGVELIYSVAPDDRPAQMFTDIGPELLSRIFVPLSPAIEERATVWLGFAGLSYGWSSRDTHAGSEDLRGVVAALVAGRQDWGPIPPTLVAPTPTADTAMPGAVGTAIIEGIATPTLPLPPAVPTVYPTAPPTPTPRPTPFSDAAAPVHFAAPTRLTLHPDVEKWERDAGTIGIALTKAPILAPAGDGALVAVNFDERMSSGEVWIVPLDGDPPVALGAEILNYAWAPDGQRVVYAKAPLPQPGASAARWDINIGDWYVVGRDGSGRRKLGQANINVVAVTAEGILTLQRDALWLVPFSGDEAHATITLRDGNGGAAALSPDGTRIAYTCTGGLCLQNRDGSGWVLVDAQAARAGIGALTLLTWSLDGTLVGAMQSSQYMNGGADLLLATRDGLSQSNVPIGGDGGVSSLAALAKGRFLVGVTDANKALHMIAVDPASRGVWEITPPGLGAAATLTADGTRLLFTPGRGEFWASDVVAGQ